MVKVISLILMSEPPHVVSCAHMIPFESSNAVLEMTVSIRKHSCRDESGGNDDAHRDVVCGRCHRRGWELEDGSLELNVS